MTPDEATICNRPGRFVLFGELAYRARSNKDWLVRGLLGAGEMSAFYGVPGDGKSVLVQDMAMHTAAGWPWFGRKVKQGSVIYFALERKALVERRALAFQLEHNVNELPFAIAGGGGVLDFRNPKVCDKIAEVITAAEDITGQEVALVVIDTLSRALCGGDENSSKDMGAIIQVTSRLQDKTGAHLCSLHHVPHGADRLRGHELPGRYRHCLARGS